MKYSIILIIMVCSFSCNRFEDFAIELPDPLDLELDEQIIWVNGEEMEFVTEDNVQFWESDNIIVYALKREYIDVGNGRTIFSFRGIELVEQSFKLINENEDRAKRNEKLTGVFAKSGAGADARVAEYRYVSSKDELFELTFVDKENRIVAGRFKANFKMTRSRGFKQEIINLPEFVAMEGVFHESY